MKAAPHLNESERRKVLLDNPIRQRRVRNPDPLQVEVEARVFVDPVRDVWDVYRGR